MDLKQIKKQAKGIKLEWLMKNGKIRVYESVRTNVKTILNRASLFGSIPFDKKSPFLVSVLDNSQDIIQDFNLSKDGFNYIKRVLKLKVVDVLE